MTQAQLIVLLLKIGLISGFISLTGWIAVYTKLAKWWTNQIGWTLVSKTALIAGLFIPTTLSLFFTMNPYVVGWIDVTLIGLVTPVMVWRSVVWIRSADPVPPPAVQDPVPGGSVPAKEVLDG